MHSQLADAQARIKQGDVDIAAKVQEMEQAATTAEGAQQKAETDYLAEKTKFKQEMPQYRADVQTQTEAIKKLNQENR